MNSREYLMQFSTSIDNLKGKKIIDTHQSGDIVLFTDEGEFVLITATHNGWDWVPADNDNITALLHMIGYRSGILRAKLEQYTDFDYETYLNLK